MDKDQEDLVSRIGKRARNLFLSRQLLCTEAVITVLNEGLGGGLPPELAVHIASGFPEGMAGAGCVCGALNGGVMALGLFLGRNSPGLLNRRRVMAATRALHDGFKERFGSTCCRVLTKEVKEGSGLHFQHCAELTGVAAEMASRLILEAKPNLVNSADRAYLDQNDSKLLGRWKQVSNLFGHSMGK